MREKTLRIAVLISAALILSSCSISNGDPALDGTAETFLELKKITASDAADFGRFGTCVAIDGDQAIVGGGFSGDIRGAAYIFNRLQGGPDNWGEVKKIQGGDTVSLDSFGYAVAIDGEDAVVGAAFAGPEVTGAAYVFSRDHGGADNWGEAKKLVASDAERDAYFGWSVAIDGDLVAVGAPGHGSQGPEGAVYVFHRDAGGPGNWGEIKKIVPTSADHFNMFGMSVALSGGVLAVGAPYSEMGILSGAAYIFLRNLGGEDNWGEAKRIVPSDSQEGDHFGSSISLDRDDVVVGAEYEDGAGEERGAAYVFSRNQEGNDNWGEIKKLAASGADDMDNFGFSVAISGEDIIIGAPYEGKTLNSRGTAYIYRRDEGGPNAWGEVKKSIANDAQAGDAYGYSVDLDGDYAVVGARSKNGPGSYQGAVYILKRQ